MILMTQVFLLLLVIIGIIPPLLTNTHRALRDRHCFKCLPGIKQFNFVYKNHLAGVMIANIYLDWAEKNMAGGCINCLLLH